MLSWFKRKNIVAENDGELQRFLQPKHCNGCSKNCSLSSPKCGRGKKLATIEMANYTRLSTSD
ncbi:MAG: hypothetical protein ABF904_10245 [Ethanoligenens sp.]